MTTSARYPRSKTTGRSIPLTPSESGDSGELRPLLQFAGIAVPVGWVLLTIPLLIDSAVEPFVLGTLLFGLVIPALVLTARSESSSVKGLLRDTIRVPRPLWLLVPAALLIPGSYSPIYHDLWFGNVMILMSAALVVGFRYSGTWAFILLTKVTPGIGLVWFAVRREWRALAIALGITAAIALASFALAPHLWFEWVGSLRSNASTPEVQGWSLATWPFRLAAAALLIGVAARINAKWVLPIALFLAQPVTWFIGFTLATAWIGMHRHRAWLARPGAAA